MPPRPRLFPSHTHTSLTTHLSKSTLTLPLDVFLPWAARPRPLPQPPTSSTSARAGPSTHRRYAATAVQTLEPGLQREDDDGGRRRSKRSVELVTAERPESSSPSPPKSAQNQSLAGPSQYIRPFRNTTHPTSRLFPAIPFSPHPIYPSPQPSKPSDPFLPFLPSRYPTRTLDIDRLLSQPSPPPPSVIFRHLAAVQSSLTRHAGQRLLAYCRRWSDRSTERKVAEMLVQRGLAKAELLRTIRAEWAEVRRKGLGMISAGPSGRGGAGEGEDLAARAQPGDVKIVGKSSSQRDTLVSKSGSATGVHLATVNQQTGHSDLIDDPDPDDRNRRKFNRNVPDPRSDLIPNPRAVGIYPPLEMPSLSLLASSSLPPRTTTDDVLRHTHHLILTRPVAPTLEESLDTLKQLSNQDDASLAVARLEMLHLYLSYRPRVAASPTSTKAQLQTATETQWSSAEMFRPGYQTLLRRFRQLHPTISPTHQTLHLYISGLLSQRRIPPLLPLLKRFEDEFGLLPRCETWRIIAKHALRVGDAGDESLAKEAWVGWWEVMTVASKGRGLGISRAGRGTLSRRPSSINSLPPSSLRGMADEASEATPDTPPASKTAVNGHIETRAERTLICDSTGTRPGQQMLLNSRPRNPYIKPDPQIDKFTFRRLGVMRKRWFRVIRQYEKKGWVRRVGKDGYQPEDGVWRYRLSNAANNGNAGAIGEEGDENKGEWVWTGREWGDAGGGRSVERSEEQRE